MTIKTYDAKTLTPIDAAAPEAKMNTKIKSVPEILISNCQIEAVNPITRIEELERQLAEAQAACAEMRKALEFYARNYMYARVRNSGNGAISDIDVDQGRTARVALYNDKSAGVGILSALDAADRLAKLFEERIALDGWVESATNREAIAAYRAARRPHGR